MQNTNNYEQDKKTSLDDVAKALGVSKSTVSRVISGKGRIGTETRQRVLKCVEEMNYRPNLIAKSLAQSRTFNIGVVLPADKELTEIPFFQACLMGICDVTSALDYDVVVTTSTSSDITQIKRIVDNRKVDGIILTRAVANDPAVKYLCEEKIPFVLIGSSADDSIVQIDIDHEAACCELTSYLISSGCKRPALLLGSRSHIVNISRYNGYINAFNKIESKAYEGIVYENINGRSAVERAVADLLDKECDCVVCGDDYICSRVLTALDERGVSVPRNIKAASFYNSAFLINHNPPVTAVTADATDIGIEAGRTIYDMITKAKVPKKIRLGYELSIKKSTF